jgi:hypothetical protein
MTDNDGNSKQPSMRQKMLDHRVRSDCIQCHSMMDPIGFALENFDAIAGWRTTDEGNAIDPTSSMFDGTKVNGPAGVRNWLVGYSDQFAEVAAEKLLTYALGRGVETYDAPAVRAIVRQARQQDFRMSSIILGVATSTPFQMRAPR